MILRKPTNSLVVQTTWVVTALGVSTVRAAAQAAQAVNPQQKLLMEIAPNSRAKESKVIITVMSEGDHKTVLLV